MPTANPLQRQVEVLRLTDGEVRRILNASAQEAQRLVNKYGSDTMRAAQIRLNHHMTEVWAGIESATKVGIGDSVYQALEFQALFDEDVFKAAGINRAYWTRSMLATAQQGAEALISRKQNGYTLSRRVYLNNAASRRGLEDTINAALALGKSQREIARDVARYIQPNVPGGVSSAAMRLARTEVNNAYHTTAIRKAQETPWVELMIWHLSGSHPRPDECNEYADNQVSPRAPVGSWKVDEVPDKPHPNCLCYVTPEAMDIDKYAKAFKAGKFDDYIDAQMGCSRVA